MKLGQELTGLKRGVRSGDILIQNETTITEIREKWKESLFAKEVSKVLYLTYLGGIEESVKAKRYSNSAEGYGH